MNRSNVEVVQNLRFQTAIARGRAISPLKSMPEIKIPMISDGTRLIAYLLLVSLCLATSFAADASIADHVAANSTSNDSLSSGLSQSSQESLSELEGPLVPISYTKVRPTVKSADNLSIGDPDSGYLNSIDNKTEATDDSSTQKESATNTTEASETSDVNTIASQNSKKAEVAAYVYNDDDDSLDVSLYIDSVPKGKTDVSKGEEETFGNFTLNHGIHRFKIIWKDSDTEKVYESEIEKEITGDDVISLYTTGHNEPEEFDLTASVKNENDKSIKAYLYIDGIYEDNQEISEESTDDISDASVEEGVHDVSVRWLDPYTNDQYEKKKRVTIEGDSAVIFVANKGASFKDLSKAAETVEDSVSSETLDFGSRITTSKAPGTLNASESENGGGTYDVADNDYNGEENSNLDNADNAGTSNDATVDNIAQGEKPRSENTGTQDAVKTRGTYSVRILSTIDGLFGDNSKAKEDGWSNLSIIYPLVLLAAAYLVFRH